MVPLTSFGRPCAPFSPLPRFLPSSPHPRHEDQPGHRRRRGWCVRRRGHDGAQHRSQEPTGLCPACVGRPAVEYRRRVHARRYTRWTARSAGSARSGGRRGAGGAPGDVSTGPGRRPPGATDTQRVKRDRTVGDHASGRLSGPRPRPPSTAHPRNGWTRLTEDRSNCEQPYGRCWHAMRTRLPISGGCVPSAAPRGKRSQHVRHQCPAGSPETRELSVRRLVRGGRHRTACRVAVRAEKVIAPSSTTASSTVTVDRWEKTAQSTLKSQEHPSLQAPVTPSHGFTESGSEPYVAATVIEPGRKEANHIKT